MAFVAGAATILLRKTIHNSERKEAFAKAKAMIIIMNKRIYISNSASDDVYNTLSRFGNVRILPDFSRLPKPVASHADMLLFPHEQTLYIPEGYYHDNLSLFADIGCKTVKDPLPEYPFDIILDCFTLGKKLICKEKYTASELLCAYESVNVNQGYARCSTLKLSDKAIITADRTIARAAHDLGCDLLEIESGYIHLEGYDCGFIGGASCVIDETVIFFGNLRTHPDADIITAFIESHGKKVVNSSSGDDMLCDFGGAVII